MVKRAEFVAEARTWIGTPFLHQGRTRHGIDCAGVAIKCAHRLGISTFDIDGYSRVPSNGMMRRLLREHTEEIPLANIDIADLLHMAFATEPQHIVIVSSIDPVMIIHADSVVGRVVEHRLDGDWRSKVRGAYRIPL